jgi:hypothetical protein
VNDTVSEEAPALKPLSEVLPGLVEASEVLGGWFERGSSETDSEIDSVRVARYVVAFHAAAKRSASTAEIV